MYLLDKIPGPVVIGGLGGSGTRVIAEIVEELGYYLGDDLNRPKDNLIFTLLFRRPSWWMKMQTDSKTSTAIDNGLNIFEKSMNGCRISNIKDIAFVLKAALDFSFADPHHRTIDRLVWPTKRLTKLFFFNRSDLSRYIGWGWKEPNTHIYIKNIFKYFYNLKYIHLVRHGLDMAYSKNQNQLKNWGFLFNIKVPEDKSLLPKAALTYWIKANAKAISFGQKHLKNRFLLLNFDNLCANPENEISALLEFLQLNAKSTDISGLKKIPKMPKSVGRYKNKDLSIFDREELVKHIGFKI